MSSARGHVSPSAGPIVRCGHLRKLKTLKKKFFVLRGDAPGHSACLEYYDSKKKFNNRQPPKRSISMRSCFNINRRVDTKHVNVIALYTKDECFSLILDNEKDLEEWLNAMLLLAGDVPDGEQPRPTFEHVWQVTMQKKGLGERKNIHGLYRLCLTDRTLSLVKVGANDNTDPIEFSLICIRRCGYMERIFYMEVGRSAITGGGDFWMEAEDNNIAHNMHAAILNAMSSSSSTATTNTAVTSTANSTAGTAGSVGNKDDVGPRQRVRSSSANEASKPISVLQRRHTGAKLHGYSPLEERRTAKEQVDPLRDQNVTASAPSQCSQSQSTSSTNTLTGATGRDRCDSLPSRARTTSEGYPTPVVLGHPRGGHLAPHVPRPHSMYGRGLSYSPPVSSMPISPASGACSTDSAGSSLSMDDGPENILEESSTLSRYGHSLTPDEPAILEENIDDYVLWTSGHQPHKYSPNFKSHSPSQQSSYVEMYSPCGSSSGRSGSTSAAYMPMSPATGATTSSQHHHQPQHNHSRGSSLIEETTLSDGYVPMAPVGHDGYVDMDPLNAIHHNGHFPDDMSQHGGSSCSVTSGTPSTDLRFSEYHLDKVTSYLATGDDTPARPIRAYSVGSRPEPMNRHRRNRLDIAQQEASRVRAFSVGSRSKRPEIIGRLASVIAARLPGVSNDSTSSNKSNSAPLLSSSWGHNSGCSVTSERMEDLMELDFTKPIVARGDYNSPPSSSYSQSQSQSQSYSTVTDTSSYVDMSPGQIHGTGTTTTAPYVDMSGMNKTIRNNSNNNNNNNTNNNNNNNNNNNTTTANHNHNHAHATTSVASTVYKPIIKTLKPVEEGAYMRMESSPEEWPRTGSSPKQAASPMQDDYMQMNGPPGVTRTAPVDLPQPRRPPDGYVEMSFKSRPTIDQDYINMSLGTSSGSGASSRARARRIREASRNDKSQRSKPIAIKSSTKTSKTPSFLPLNGSPTSESLASTPASPPRATPTGSTATIFPFSLNSPQSPIKPFESANSRHDDNVVAIALPTTRDDDYAIMTNDVTSNSATKNKKSDCEISSSNPLTKLMTELTIGRTRIGRNRNDVNAIANVDDDATNRVDKNDPDPNDSNEASCSRSSQQTDTRCHSPITNKRLNDTTTLVKQKISIGNFSNDETSIPSTLTDDRGIVNASTTTKTSEETSIGTINMRIGDFNGGRTKSSQISPNSSMTSASTGFKVVQKTSSGGKIVGDETNVGTSGATIVSGNVATAATPIDSEGYEKLQPGATILHYASLDLPEIVNGPPISPTPVVEGFTYAEIDFAKLKQN